MGEAAVKSAVNWLPVMCENDTALIFEWLTLVTKAQLFDSWSGSRC